MKWEIVPPRDLQLMEIAPEEKEYIIKLGEWMKHEGHGIRDAKSVVENVWRDVLERGYLENRRLNRSETLTQFSAWCDTHWKHRRVWQYAGEISKTLFAGLVIPRLIDTKGRTLPEAESILDEFLQKMVEQLTTYTFTPRIQKPYLVDGRVDISDILEELGGPDRQGGESGRASRAENRTSRAGSFVEASARPVNLERDLMDFLVDNPQAIEPDLKLLSKEYETAVGTIDALYEAQDGALVVVETRRGRAGDELVGQVLRYMGWLRKHKQNLARGIIIVGESDEQLEYAAGATENIKLLRYRVSFELSEIPV